MDMDEARDRTSMVREGGGEDNAEGNTACF